MRSPSSGGLTIRSALLLGALHGPAELLPISSSAHLSVLPLLLGSSGDRLDPELDKSFQVALHGGTALALIAGTPGNLGSRSAELDGRRLSVLGLSCAPPALAGYLWESQIEGGLGTPRTIAAALTIGAVAMMLADRAPEKRRCADAGARDAFYLGIAQAAALVPGISRAGATRAAARWLTFRRLDAKLLSDQVALPVLLGATLLKAVRLRRRGLEPSAAVPFAAGAGASFASTLACAAVAERPERSHRLLPFAAYRVALASWILIRLGRSSTARPPGLARPRSATRSPAATAAPAPAAPAVDRPLQPRR